MKRIIIFVLTITLASMNAVCTPTFNHNYYTNGRINAIVKPSGAGVVYIEPVADNAVKTPSVEGEVTTCEQTFGGSNVSWWNTEKEVFEAKLVITPSEGFHVNQITTNYREDGMYNIDEVFTDTGYGTLWGVKTTPGEKVTQGININTFGGFAPLATCEEMNQKGVAEDNFANYVYELQDDWSGVPETTIYINMGKDDLYHEYYDNCSGKKLYAAIESYPSDKGQVYLSSEVNYAWLFGAQISEEDGLIEKYEESELGTYSELKTILRHMDAYPYITPYCMSLNTIPSLGYGLLGYVKDIKEDGNYSEEDFVKDILGRKAVNRSLVNVDDINQPADHMHDGDEFTGERVPTEYSEQPNHHFYAVYQKIPEFEIEDGESMTTPNSSTTGKYSITFRRHLNKGWNALCLPVNLCKDDFRGLPEGSKIAMALQYDKNDNVLYFGIGLGNWNTTASYPFIVYCPEEYDWEMFISDRALNAAPTDMSDGQIKAVFKNTSTDKVCYNLVNGDNGITFEKSEDNIIPAFRWAITVDEKDAPTFQAPKIYVGNENATAINMINADSATRSAIYTLDGKQLDSEPQKGVYIKDGKKVVK